MKQLCFICGNPSHEFERKAKVAIVTRTCMNNFQPTQGFGHHVQNEHCMWNYIYFYLHLGRIDINDHNAIESYIWNQVHN